MALQLPLLRENGALVIAAGAPLVCFEVEGEPQHKQRHRYRIIVPKFGKAYAQEYTPKDTAAYEQAMKWLAKAAMHGRPPSERPVCLMMHVFKSVPKSWSAKEQDAALRGAILPTSKPDDDNYLKIRDALDGVVWKDDSQCCDSRVIKLYSDVPGLRIEVREFVEP